MKSKIKNGFFIVLMLLIIYLAARVVWPYISYIILSVIIAYTLRPLYLWLEQRIKRPWLSSIIMVLLVLIVLVAPGFFIVKSLIDQSTHALSSLRGADINSINQYLSNLSGQDINLGTTIDTAVSNIQNVLFRESLNLISSIADIVIGLVIMFFTMYYAFKDGSSIFENIVDALPLRKDHTKVLVGEVQLVTNAVIYGQLVTAMVQGTVAGIGYIIFQIPNPIFWGFVTGVMSFLPIVGTPIIFIPLGIVELVNGNFGSGIGILAYGLIMIMNIDNVIKPFIISERSQLNAAMILIGVVGGIKAFGFMGFILGPMVLGLLVTFLKVFRQDFKPSEELKKAHEKNDNIIIPLHSRPPDAHRRF